MSTDVQVVEERVTCLTKEFDQLAKDNKYEHSELWKAVARPPIWVTAIIGLLTMIIGLLAGWTLK